MRTQNKDEDCLNDRNCSNHERDDQRKQRKLIPVILAIIIIIILISLIRSCGTSAKQAPRNDVLLEMTEGNLNEAVHKTPEEIQDELQKKVEEGTMNISMNLNPSFSGASEAGNLLIVNDKINRHAQIVEIYLKGESRRNNDTPIYYSGVIPVGGEIAYDTLDYELSAGKHECVAYFYSVDSDGRILGIAAAEVNIHIQE